MARPDIPDAARDAAIAWHLRLEDADEKTWLEFTSWLEADPANRLAFDNVEDVDTELDNGIFREPSEKTVLAFPQRARAWRAAPWIAAGIAASLVLAFEFLTGAPEPAVYATHTGETRAVTLADGTRIDINTATMLVADGARHVTLEKGEALFHVTKDANHPFMVTVGDRNIRDIGTVFDVLRNAGTLSVFVAEGKVGVSPRGATREVALEPGDRLVHSEITGLTQVEKVDPDQALAWRRGYLVYRNAPLSAVASDLNRYFPVPIALDERAATERFTGVLRIDNQNAVLDRIARFLPVTVDRGKDGRIILRASAARP